MKCISCEVEINPKWKHAIDINVCPFCGEGIMEEHLKNLLTSLGETMSKLQEYPDQVNDWLLSNYNYIKTDSPNLAMYMPKEYMQNLVEIEKEKDFIQRKNKPYKVKIRNENGEIEEILAEKIQSEADTNGFAERAEAIKPNIDKFPSIAAKTEHLKRMYAEIKKTGSAALTNDTGESAVITPEMLANADPNEIEEMEALSGISSSIDTSLDDDDALPPFIEKMLVKSNNKSSTYNPKDVEALQKMQARLNKSREDFENGNNRGKGGGFSRA